MTDGADDGVVIAFVPDRSEGKTPTGRCECDHKHWHFGDSMTDDRPVTCLSCGNHWWMRTGVVVEGPPFTPYTEILAHAGLLSLDHVRRPAAPGLPVGEFAKNVTRWNYLTIPALNPWAGSIDGRPGPFEFEPDVVDAIGHDGISAEVERLFKAGDTEIIFKFVERDAMAFRSPWVVAQIEEWRRAGKRKELIRLMERYASSQHRPPMSELVDVIRKDQRVFRALVERPQGQPLLDAAIGLGELGVTSEADAKLIHRHYRPIYDSVVPVRFSPAQFFEELDSIADRIAAATIG